MIDGGRTGDDRSANREGTSMNDETRVFTRSGLQIAVAAAVAADRRRVAAILTLPEAAGRAGLALSIATTTDQSVADAKAALAAASADKPADPAVATDASALWDRALSARGLPMQKSDAPKPPDVTASLDASLKSRGMQVG
ncbi:hypothetical protein EI171_21080 [Bradyrhizobium sp. LCT2]|uniref:hypothetical protein n=1 Tax=Bradyrhizobium sp. LCT2 TaxID=2493093 RepID=UPI001373FA7C|nr:hypothetical protein [Bradyrhizobium sp. LCT2]QHP69561.1 hypothetical protein EI171_21080 [Bradyrhizobium sp. LCT2]